jgi:hypothetical protein
MEVVSPELVLLWVAYNSPNQHLSFFASSVLADLDVVNQGGVNEKIFRLSLETLFSHDPVDPSSMQAQPLGEVLSFFASTKLAGWLLCMQPNGLKTQVLFLNVCSLMGILDARHMTLVAGLIL